MQIFNVKLPTKNTTRMLLKKKHRKINRNVLLKLFLNFSFCIFLTKKISRVFLDLRKFIINNFYYTWPKNFRNQTKL